jgi:hypothetical protein
MKVEIILRQNTIVVGEIELPVHEIRYVDVTPHASRTFVVLVIVAASIFLLTAASLVTLAAVSIISGTANTAAVSWTIGIFFFTGAILSGGIFLFAMVAYPIEWRVQVVTKQGILIVRVERSGMRARIYANRLRRLLGEN